MTSQLDKLILWKLNALEPARLLLSRTMSLTKLRKIDEAVSGVIFEASLPPTMETLLSIPGTWFGMTHGPIIFPLWTACLLEPAGPSKPLALVTAGLFILFLVLWRSYLRGNKLLLRCAMCKEGYLLAPVISVALLRLLVSNPETLSYALFPLVMFFPSVAPAIHLKKYYQRWRPCIKYPHFILRKEYPVIPKVLAKSSSDASFPSGDAVASVVYAMPIFASRPGLASAMVFLSCFGRVYFLAHHVCDTLAGVLVALCMYGIATYLGLSMTDLQWWHPLLAEVTWMLFPKEFMKIQRHPVK